MVKDENQKITGQVTGDEVDFRKLSLIHKQDQLPIPFNHPLIAAKQAVQPQRPQPSKQETSIDVAPPAQSRPSKPPSRATKSSPIAADNRGQIFGHIPKRRTDLDELTKSLGYKSERIHSAMIRIGLKMNQNQIYDPTNRCIAFLVALKTAVEEYVPCGPKPIARDLEQKLDEYVQFLDQCRPLSVSMRNVIRIMRSYISKLSAEWSADEARSHLLDLIDKFVYEEIECGLNGIREHGNLKIGQDDVILTFGNSFLIKHIFREAKQAGKRFRVIVVDSAPRLDGKQLVQFLGQLNIDATYVLINALSYVMKEVNKVLLEAHTLLANGYMISEMGSSQIALVAKSHNVPVLICCETYKFSERVHTDSFVFNEAGEFDKANFRSFLVATLGDLVIESRFTEELLKFKISLFTHPFGRFGQGILYQPPPEQRSAQTVYRRAAGPGISCESEHT